MNEIFTPPMVNLQHTGADNRLIGLWRLMAGFRLRYAGATVSMGLATLFNTATFLLIRYLVDEVLGGEQSLDNALPLVAIGFIGLAILRGLFTFLTGRFAAQTAEGIALRVRNYLFDHIQRLSFGYHDKIETGDLIQRATSDVDAVRRFFAEEAIGVGRILLLFTVNFVAILSLNWQLALASVVVVPILIIMSLFFFRRISIAYEAYQDQEAILSTRLQENLTGVRVVKAFARQDYERERFEGDNSERYRRGRRLLFMHSIFWPITDFLTGIQLVVGYYVGARMVIDGTITLGTYMAFAFWIIWIIFPMRNLGRLIVHISTGIVSLDRIMEIAREERENLAENASAPVRRLRGELIFDRVSFEYEPGVPVLHDVSFRCEAGTVIALLGSTGSGKTTVASLIPRFYDYTGGSIKLDGVELNQYPRDFLRRHIGIVEQEPFLFSRSLHRNIAFGTGRDAPTEAIEAAARAAAIHNTITHFPLGYRTRIGEKGVTLSGGQKQRVALARTILKDPAILILDDATSSVDTETEATIREALQELMQNRTTFVIAHRIQSVMNADLILVFDHGRIIQQGTHEELMEQGGHYRKIYDLQSRIEVELEEEIARVEP